MDLDLLDRTLADAGEPAFRARQAWEWTAGGASGYDEMTNLPVALRSRLAERGEPAFRARQVWEWAARGAGSYEEMTNLPLELREALASDGTEKALFHTHDERPVEAVLMR